jgi:bacillithiol biosynthesis cysteine-adding enzyme BshC
MTEQSIRPVKEFRLSNLFLDFLGERPVLNKYFFARNPFEVAANLGDPKIDRNILSDILFRQNTIFRAKPGTFDSIEKLKRDDAICVFAGQQAGLFGGSLLTLYKAIGIVKRARLIEKELHHPVVPIFWIAADDHDFEEINHSFYINHHGEIERISYDSPPKRRVPAAEIFFDDKEAYGNLVDDVQKAFGNTDFTTELYDRLFRAYTSGNSFVTAFAQYLLDIMPDLGLVMFSPADKEIKTLSRDFLKRLAEGHFRMKELMQETARSLENDGYHLQAEKKESAAHLFYHAPQRIPIHFEDGVFLVEDKRLGLPGLLDLIDKHPEKFSPDVLTRPLWQSYLFPVVAQAGGPSEIGYFSQIGKLFELFNLIQPFYFFRPALTIIERRHEILLDNFKIRLTDLAGDIEGLVNDISIRSFPKEIEQTISEFRETLEEDYRGFLKAVMQFDESLEPMGKQTYGKIDFAFGAFEKKIYDHHKKRMEATRNQIYRLATMLFPNKNLQERSFNINYYIAKYGFGVVDFIADKIDASAKEHQLIYISEYLT